MVTANRSFFYYLLISVLTLPTLVGCSKLSASVDVTSFHCVEKDGKWQTIAQKGNKISNVPLFNWNTQEFGFNYTPEKRCGIVSDELSEAVISNDGRLGGLTLTYGTVNDLTVVCVLDKKQKDCNDKNMLFTLNQNNAQNPRQVLADMKAFATGEDKTINESGLPQFILLEDLVDESMKDDNNKSVW